MSVNAMTGKFEDTTVLWSPMILPVCVWIEMQFQTACICTPVIYKEKER